MVSSALAKNYQWLQGTIVKIKYYGEVMWAAPVNFKGHCKVDVRYFPFDRQRCEMKFGPWQHDGTELIVEGKGEDLRAHAETHTHTHTDTRTHTHTHTHTHTLSHTHNNN